MLKRTQLLEYRLTANSTEKQVYAKLPHREDTAATEKAVIVYYNVKVREAMALRWQHYYIHHTLLRAEDTAIRDT